MMTFNSNGTRISIVAPAYNEAAGIEAVLLRWYDFLINQPEIADFEIVICNDGSTDSTGDILNTLALHHSNIHPIHLKKNQGAAAALAAAIAHTHYEWVLVMDADDQFPIENLPRMMAAKASSQVMAVLGVRQKKDHYWARVGSAMSGFICNLTHGSRLKDFNSAFKLVDGALLRSMTFEAKGMNYSTELTSRLLEVQAPLMEVDILHQVRQSGKSHLRWGKDSFHRLLFVGYLSLRQWLFKLDILRRSYDNEP